MQKPPERFHETAAAPVSPSAGPFVIQAGTTRVGASFEHAISTTREKLDSRPYLDACDVCRVHGSFISRTYFAIPGSIFALARSDHLVSYHPDDSCRLAQGRAFCRVRDSGDASLACSARDLRRNAAVRGLNSHFSGRGVVCRVGRVSPGFHAVTDAVSSRCPGRLLRHAGCGFDLCGDFASARGIGFPWHAEALAKTAGR
jgi:hypothetical protein